MTFPHDFSFVYLCPCLGTAPVHIREKHCGLFSLQRRREVKRGLTSPAGAQPEHWPYQACLWTWLITTLLEP